MHRLTGSDGAWGSLGRYGPGPVVELVADMQMAAGTAVAGLECAATIVGFMLSG
jgi:hypothetical protein